MDKGEIVKIATPGELFSEDVEQYSLETPFIQKVVRQMIDSGVHLDVNNIKNLETLVEEIARSIR